MAKQDDNLMAALAYLLGWITGIVMFVLYKDKSKYVSFHAMQSIIVFLGVMVVQLVLAITIVGIALVPVVWLGAIVVWAFMMYKAYS